MSITIQTNQDSSIGTIRSDGSMSVTRPMDALSTNDSVAQLAVDSGLVNAMHQINAEEKTADNPAVEENHPSEESPRQSSRPTHRKDKRLAEMSEKLAAIAEEKESYALRNKELEIQLLNARKADINRDIEDVSNLMSRSHKINDSEGYVKANKLLSKYSMNEIETERQLQEARNEIAAQQTYAQVNNNDAYHQERSADFHRIFQPRELSSEYYQDWLVDNEIYDPFSEDYNPSLAAEMLSIKDEYNNYLYLNRQQKTIGSLDYYEKLNAIIDNVNQQKYGGGFQPSFFQEETVSQPQGEQDMRRSLGIASVAPITRTGHDGGITSGQRQLPPLTEAEKAFAEKCDMYEGPGAPGQKYGRPLQAHEKHRVYQENKEKLLGGR